MPVRRQWLFRIAALLLPLSALLMLELVLRIAGYGYPTSFFKLMHDGGQSYVVDNESFSLRFFPPELARWPTSFRFEPVKPAKTTRIFILGESAAMGDPQPSFGAGRYLEVLLRDRFPAQKFEVINLGITAINSHVILPIARECAQQHGDIWIIYMGNNEMVGPFGAATVFGTRAPSLFIVRCALAIQKTRIGQLFMELLRKVSGKPMPSSWGGMQMFLQNQIHPDDPRREQVYKNFAVNLNDIIKAAKDRGAKVLLNTVSVNLKDFPPFASLGSSNLPPDQREQFHKLLTSGITQENENQFQPAAGTFEKAALIDPKFAELHFRWAISLLHLTNSAARERFQHACDLDALPFRADTTINSTIRRIGREMTNGGVVVCDAEQLIAQSSTAHIAGDESFFEHVHFNFDGNFRLGRFWAENVEQFLPQSARAEAKPDWDSQEACERNLGLTPWNRSFVIDSVISRMSHPPLSSQFNNPTRLAKLQAELKSLQARQIGTNAVMRSGQGLVDAMQRAPEDPFLLEGFGNFLEAVGDQKQAASAYKKMLEMLPNDFYSRLQLGRMYGELGQPASGEPLLQQAARQRQSTPDAWVGLGNVQMMLAKYHEALESYMKALKLRPREASYICFQASALAKLNRNREAIVAYQRAIQLRTEQPEAHFELAGLLASENNLPEAIQHYREAIRLRPQYVVARINLGVMLFRQNRFDEASQEFETALRLDPGNASAADYLRKANERRPSQR